MGVLSLILMNHTGEQVYVYAFMFFFGAGWGATAPMFMAAATDIFKGKIFGLIYGIVEAFIGIAGAFGAWVGGFVFDRTHSYQWAFILAFAAFALACLFMWFAAPRKSKRLETS
jgi:MFS family permease